MDKPTDQLETRACLRAKLRELGVVNTSGSKKSLINRIKQKLATDAIAEIRQDLTSTGRILEPEAKESQQIGDNFCSGIYVYCHDSDFIPGRLTACKLGHSYLGAELRSLQSLQRDRNAFLNKDFTNPKAIPTYPE